MNRRIVGEISAQCAHRPRDGRVQATVDNVRYDVRVKTLPKCFETLPDTSLVDSMSLNGIGLNANPSSTQRKDSSSPTSLVDDNEKRATLSQLLFGICQRFGINFLRINENSEAHFLYHTIDYRSPPHFLPMVGVVEVDYRPTKFYKVIYLDCGTFDTLNDLALFAHHNFTVHSQAFALLAHQLVQIFRQFSARQIFPSFSPHRITVDENLWIRLSFEDVFHPRSFTTTRRSISSRANSSTTPAAGDSNESAQLWALTQRWCEWELSNLDYLLKLNEFAGRVRGGDYTRHPVLPWVVDFSAERGGLRQLDRTKYRLSKGDDQLNEQYRSQQPAYHIPELLSDICCLVYRARVELKEVLCRHIRSVWVPEEYPSTMARLYQWTPDECIPEFYEEEAADIFTSTHADMSDLGLPSWTPTPRDFLRWHRGVLESQEVSEKLHKWIDLAFGCLLSGEEAVNALNVHLSFVSLPLESAPSSRAHSSFFELSRLRKHGAVKLFTRPHPRRRSAAKNAFEAEAEASTKLNASNSLARSSSTTTSSVALPDESVLLMSALKSIRDSHGCGVANCRCGCESSLLSVGVTIVELALAEYSRQLAASAQFSDRLTRAQDLLLSKCHLLPRNLRHALKLLLRVDCFTKIRPTNYIKQPFEVFFAILPTVSFVHDLLLKYDQNEQQLRLAICADNDYNMQQAVRERVQILARCFSLRTFRDLWLQLFVDTVELCQKTAATICYRLLRPVVELSLDYGTIHLAAVIRRLFETPTKYTIKLFDRRFVLQLCVCFGSEAFFTVFLPAILEALLCTVDNSELNNDDCNTIRETTKETILWLSTRYGPYVTVIQISSRLLSLLSVCYLNAPKEIQDTEEMALGATVDGDLYCSWIVDCLIEISAIYGTAFIALQYIPFCADTITQASRRLCASTTLGGGANATLESAAVAALVALSPFCDALSDKQIMDHLQDTIVDGVLFPAARLFSSVNASFSSACVRRLFAAKTISTLHLLALRIGAENVRKHLAGTIQRVFCTFNLVYDAQQQSAYDAEKSSTSQNTAEFAELRAPHPTVHIAKNAPEQLAATFTAGFAHLLVQVFALICGRQYLHGALPNAPLVFALVEKTQTSSAPPPSPSSSAAKKTPTKTKTLQNFRPHCALNEERLGSRSYSCTTNLCAEPTKNAHVELSSSASILNGNRLTTFSLSDDAPQSPHSASSWNSASVTSAQENTLSNFNPASNFLPLNRRMGETSFAHLSGNWVDHLSSVLSQTSTTIAFNQIQLANFRGHSAAVRKLRILDNENSFVSASADRTLKLWSIRSNGTTTANEDAEVAPQWTYAAHTKPIQEFLLLKWSGQIVSTDSASVHIWDPFCGTTLHKFACGFAPPLFMREVAGMVEMDSELIGVASTENAIIRTLDARTGECCHEMCAWPPALSSKIAGLSVPINVRSMDASPHSTHKLAVALSNGKTAILDVRTGKILASFTSAHSNITQLQWLSSEILACVHAQNPLEIWTVSANLNAPANALQIEDVCLTRRLSEIASSVNLCSTSSDKEFCASKSCVFKNAQPTILQKNSSVNLFNVKKNSIQRRSSGKMPKPGETSTSATTAADAVLGAADCRNCAQFITVVQSSSLSRLRFYDDVISGNFAEVKLKADFAAGGITALAYLNMNRMLLLGCASGVIRLAC